MTGLVGKTVFTVVVLALAVVAVKWSHQSASYQQTERKILAGGAVSAENTLPVGLTLGKDVVVLGEEQTVTVTSTPRAKIALTIIYSNSQDDKEVITDVADQAGYLIKQIKTDDWHRLGPVRIIAVATDNAGVGETSRSYDLAADNLAPIVDEPTYFYPIVP